VALGRAAIWSALFGLLSPSLLTSSGGPFVTVSRRARNYAQVGPNEQPALYLLQRRETADQTRRGVPTIWHLHASIYIYARNELDGAGAGSGGSDVLNPLLDAVENALYPFPSPGQVVTLGGLVSRVFIDGEVEVDEGNVDNQAVAIIPVTIIGPQ